MHNGYSRRRVIKSKPGRTLTLVLGVVFVGVLAVIDYMTPPDVSFLVFYMIPVFLVSWYAGLDSGLVISFLSAVSWFFDDVMRRSPHFHPITGFWNVLARLGVLIAANILVVALQKALLREKEAEQERLEQELGIARQVQMRMLPQSPPAMKCLDYAGVCVPASFIGGDYYDFIPLGNGTLGIAIGDVVGHGISSALLMVWLHMIVRNRSLDTRQNLHEVMQDINRQMCESTEPNHYATLFYGCYNEGTATLAYVNAGHVPPLLLRADNSIQELTTGGTPLGLIRGAQYREASVRLNQGDRLLLFTDGVTESANGADQEFGQEGLIQALRQDQGGTARQILNSILGRLDAHRLTQLQRDDVTLVVLKQL